MRPGWSPTGPLLARVRSGTFPVFRGLDCIPRSGAVLTAWIHALVAHQPRAVIFWDEPPPSRIVRLVRSVVPRAKLIHFEHGRSWRRTGDEGTIREFVALDAVLSNSNASSILLKKRFGIAVDAILPNPLPPAIAHSPRKSQTKHHSGPFRIGFAGRLVPGKGADAAVQALAQLSAWRSDVELSIAGDGPARSSLEHLATEAGVMEKCRFAGHVQSMPDWYRSCDIVLVPSIHEAFGLVSIEAQAMGVPVIVAAVDGLPETIRPGITGLSLEPTQEIPPAEVSRWGPERLPEFVIDAEEGCLAPPRRIDPRQLALAIGQLLDDPQRLAIMGHEASAWARDTFSWESYAGRFDAALHAII